MRLGEDDSTSVLRRKVVRDHVAHEGDLSTRIALLLEPCETERMRLQRRDDVVESIAVDVVDNHLGTARRAAAVLTAERLGMIFPRSTFDLRLLTCDFRLFGLLKPAVYIKDVDAAI